MEASKVALINKKDKKDKTRKQKDKIEGKGIKERKEKKERRGKDEGMPKTWCESGCAKAFSN